MHYELSATDKQSTPAQYESKIIDGEVYELAQMGIVAADAIAISEPFSYKHADFSLRAMAKLLNGAERVDDDTLAQLGQGMAERIYNLSQKTYHVLGPEAQERARASVMGQNPRSDAEARSLLMRHGLATFQTAVSMGPGRGYDQLQEPAIRVLVQDYARTFAAAYQGLSDLGHPVATNEGQRAYFASTVRIAASAIASQSTSAAEATPGLPYVPTATDEWI